MRSTSTTSTIMTRATAAPRSTPATRTTAGVAVMAAALLAAGLSASSASATGSAAGDHARKASAAAVPTCKLGGLKVTLDDGGVDPGVRNGMSHAGIYLRFKNTTDHTCLLRGYPGLGLERTDHKALATKAEWGSTWYAKDPGKTNVRVESGDSAWADLAWTQSGTDAVQAGYLKVTPPAETKSATLRFDRLVDWGRLQVTSLADQPPKIG